MTIEARHEIGNGGGLRIHVAGDAATRGPDQRIESLWRVAFRKLAHLGRGFAPAHGVGQVRRQQARDESLTRRRAVARAHHTARVIEGLAGLRPCRRQLGGQQPVGGRIGAARQGRERGELGFGDIQLSDRQRARNVVAPIRARERTEFCELFPKLRRLAGARDPREQARRDADGLRLIRAQEISVLHPSAGFAPFFLVDECVRLARETPGLPGPNGAIGRLAAEKHREGDRDHRGQVFAQHAATPSRHELLVRQVRSRPGHGRARAQGWAGRFILHAVAMSPRRPRRKGFPSRWRE